jgi:uncharacterized protein YycO
MDVIKELIRKYLLRASIPFQHLIDKLGKPDPKITDEQYLAIKSAVQNGSILLAHDNLQSTNLFIPGFWKHAAIYCNGYVYEAVGSGVRKVLVDRWILTKDNIFVGHANFPFDNDKLEWFLEKQNGKPYDFFFEMDFLNFKLTQERAWYCAELVFGALKFAADPKVFSIQLDTVMGEKTITPQGLRDQVDAALILDYLAVN